MVVCVLFFFHMFLQVVFRLYIYIRTIPTLTHLWQTARPIRSYKDYHGKKTALNPAAISPYKVVVVVWFNIFTWNPNGAPLFCLEFRPFSFFFGGGS